MSGLYIVLTILLLADKGAFVEDEFFYEIFLQLSIISYVVLQQSIKRTFSFASLSCMI